MRIETLDNFIYFNTI